MDTIQHVQSTTHAAMPGERPWMVATHRIMDSVWTLYYRVLPGGGLEIGAHDRTMPEGFKRERELPKFQLSEAPGSRKVVAVRLSTDPKATLQPDKAEWTEYPVPEQPHVFSKPYGVFKGTDIQDEVKPE